MRMLIVAGLAGVALVSLAACNKHPASGDAAASSGAGVASAPAAPAGPVAIQSIPHRKPGLWSQTMTMSGAPTQMPSLKICVDEASEAKTSLLVQQSRDSKCGPPQLTRNLDGSITFTTSCDMGQFGKVDSTGTVKGDFNSAYTVDMNSTTTGGPAGKSETHHIALTATRVGDCAPGQVGGDIIMANGMKLNALRHAAMAGHPPGQGE